jgi:thiamine biosynthesis lipoprotein
LSARDSARTISVEAGQDCLVGRFGAMGSPCEILIESDDRELASELTQIAADEAWRIEEKFSRYIPGNIVGRINSSRGEPVEVDDETASLLDFAVTLHGLSNGRFDITSGDLGGIGKEYAVDRVAGMLSEAAACSVVVNFGGDLAVTRPPQERRAWRIGIEPVSAESRKGETVLEVRAGALATSGDSRRFLLRDGVRYSHILDPRSGWPVQGAPRSVTVAADTCTQAGMLSTLAMLEGYNAEAFLDAEGLKHWCRR